MKLQNLQRFVAAGCVLLTSLLLGACGGEAEAAKSLDSAKVSRFLSQDATERLGVVIDVTCPKSIPADKGQKFTCIAQTADGDAIPLVATQRDAKGSITWRMKARSTGAIEDEIEQGVRKQKQLKVAVDCPDLIAFNEGASFVCVATQPQGKRTFVVVTQVDDKGGITWSA